MLEMQEQDLTGLRPEVYARRARNDGEGAIDLFQGVFSLN